MKRSIAPAPKHDALARKRALIRSLIEQHGWASKPASEPARDGREAAQSLPQNIIPFPYLGK
jgi:hypothetical protein